MIYVSEDQFNQVNYLIQQSMQGHHVLFDSNILNRIFKKDRKSFSKNIRNKNTIEQNISTITFSDDEAYTAEHHIERLMTLPELAQQKAYLEGLDELTLEKVVRTYFKIIEMNMIESLEVTH